MASSACGCLWPREPLSHVILCSVLSVTVSKCTHVTLHTGAIHSPEPQVAVCQVPENKVPFTLLLSISSSQRALREKKFSEFIAGELRLKTSETTVLRAQSFNYRVKMCTRLWSLCAHLHAWTSPMVTFCHLERVEEGDILSWSNRWDLLTSPCSLHQTFTQHIPAFPGESQMLNSLPHLTPRCLRLETLLIVL